MSESSAKVICDSISPDGHRLTTFEVVMHRFVLAEFNTHRVFSRNSASSRAIPMSITLKQYDEDPAMPLSYPAEKSGMQGGAELEGVWLENAQLLLEVIRDTTHAFIKDYIDAHDIPEHRLHKSVLNRYLEPFRWHTVVVTATDWDGFWRQRCSPLAQPEMRVVAEAMEEAYNFSQPHILGPGQWHLPYLEDGGETPKAWSATGDALERFKKVSVARCTRVSYDRQGEGSVEECLKLFERLSNADPEHSSPFEHIATPCTCAYVVVQDSKMLHRLGTSGNQIHQGNFHGFDQFRHQVFGR